MTSAPQGTLFESDDAMPAPNTAQLELTTLKMKALEVHRRLCKVLGCPIRFFANREPMDEIISSLLSHRTKNRDSARAYRTMREHYPTWLEVMNAAPLELQQAILASTWAEQKAPRIQAVLREIMARRGSFNLDFLGDLPVPEARAWLESLPGVGPKTSAATLLFSRLRRPALPVDSHHHRVAARVGLIKISTPVGKAHALLEGLLPPDWDAQTVYDHHEVLMLHGQQTCHFMNPRCHDCVLNSICDWFQGGFRNQSEVKQGQRRE
jgi:endonuclease III